MLLPVARLAQRMPERPVQRYAARRFDLLGISSDDRNPNRCDADPFNLSLDQSDRLIAEPSGRGQQDQVDLIRLEPLRHFPGGLLDQGGDVRPVDMAHEAVMGFGQFAEQPFVAQLS